MGQGLSCCVPQEHWRFFQAIVDGDTDRIARALQQDPFLLEHAKHSRHRLSPLHLAASKGRVEVLATLLEHGACVDVLDRRGKTPLMLACKNNRWVCARRLLDSGANVLVSEAGSSCLHHAAKGGNSACVQKMLLVASTGNDLVEFVDMYDSNGVNALHLASLKGHVAIVRQLLNHGANISAISLASSQYVGLGSGRSALHFAALGGSVACVKELLAWGADKSQRDWQSCTAYRLALDYHNFACAAILDPHTTGSLLWPSPLECMNELEPETRCLLEAALVKANEEQKRRKHRSSSMDSGELSLGGSSHKDTCSICFERSCAIEIVDCGHRMCATCMLRLCCSESCKATRAPICPFCRCQISHISTLVHSDAALNSSSSSSSKLSSRRFKRRPAVMPEEVGCSCC